MTEIKAEAEAQSDPFAYRSDAYAWFVVFMLCLAQVISFIDRQIITLLVDPIREDLGITDVQISWLQGFAFALFYGVIAIPIGRMVDSKNRKAIVAIGMVIFSLATAICGVAKAFWQLFVARMFVGIGEATLSPSTFSMLADYFPRKTLTRALSIFTGSGFIGSGIALVLGGVVIEQMLAIGPVDLGFLGTIRPWQMTFMAVSLPGLVLVVVLWFTVREPPRISAAKQETESALSLKQAWIYLMDNKRVLGSVVFGFTFLAMMMFSLGAWVPTFFIRTYGMSIGDIGSIFGVYFMVLGTSGVICGGVIADWLRARGYGDSNMRAGIFAAVMTMPFVAAFPLAGDQTWSLVLLAPVIFFGTMPFGTGPSALPLIVPNRLRGQVVALYLLVATLLGQGCGPWFVAMFTDYVLQDPNLIRYSISVVCPVILLIGAAILYWGAKPYAAHVEKLEQTHESM